MKKLLTASAQRARAPGRAVPRLQLALFTRGAGACLALAESAFGAGG